MSFIDSFKSFFKKSSDGPGGSLNELPFVFLDSETTTAFKNYGINLVSTKIGNAVSLCDFVEYSKGKIRNDHYWYKFNYQPNINQNAPDFWSKVVNKMITSTDGALVYQDNNGDLHVADSFTTKKEAFKETIYENVYFEGKSVVGMKLSERDVFIFKYHDSKAIRSINSVYADYSDLMSNSIKNYNRSNAQKYQLKIDSTFDQLSQQPVLDENGDPFKREDGSIVTEYDQIIDDIFENRFKGVLSEKDSITAMESGLSLEKIGDTKGNTKSGAATTRDITDIFKDIIYICSDPFSIPRAYMLGDVADAEVVTENFIKDTVKPFVEIILTEVNRKIYTKEELLKNSKIIVKTYALTTNDPIKFAASAEALLRTGLYTINMLLEMMGEEPIDDEIGDKRFMTKNYQTYEEMKAQIKEDVNTAIEKVFI